jgi:hypothetical protein
VGEHEHDLLWIAIIMDIVSVVQSILYPVIIIIVLESYGDVCCKLRSNIWLSHAVFEPVLRIWIGLDCNTVQDQADQKCILDAILSL